MAFALGTHFLLFLWFSGVNHFVHPSTEAGTGVDTDYSQYQQQQQQEEEESSHSGATVLLSPLAEEFRHYPAPPHHNHHHHLRHLSMPPSHVDPIQDEPLLLRRQYRLEDFLWTGSGDGPHPSEVDGGLAWEDNGGGGGGGTSHHVGGGGSSIDSQKHWIRVTKTMTLYRTVLTTIYPVEMTPTVVSGRHSHAHASPTAAVLEPTPTLPPVDNFLSASPSDSMSESDSVPDSNIMWIPTPTFSPTAPPEPTAMPPDIPVTLPPQSSTSTSSPTSPSSSDNSLEAAAASTDPVFWIQTSIKANNSAYRDTPRVFQQAMQKSLASVYASAFKRHLLSTLGVLPPSSKSNNSNNDGKNQRKRRRRRKRRWTYHGGLDQLDNHSQQQDNSKEEEPADDEDNHLHQWLYVAQSSMSPQQLKHLATAAMNVTVTIINVTDEAPPKVDLRYVVLAEGTPVPAFSAVKELELVSKKEMEDMLGYEIINKKAEALVAGPPEQMTRNEQYVATSPWLIVAVTTMCLLVILLALIGFMVWKWKHNRLGDAGGGRAGVGGGRTSSATPARPQSGIGDDDDEHVDEEGVINPAFLGTPKRTGRGETLDQSPKSSPASRSLLSARHRAITATRRITDVITRLPGSGGGSGKSKGKGREEEEEDEEEEDETERKRRQRDGKKKGKREQWNSPSSSEDLRVHKQSGKPTTAPNFTSSEGSADWKELLGEPRPKMPATSGVASRKRSPVRGATKTGGGGGGAKSAAASKEMLRRKRKKSKFAEEANLRTDFDGEEEDDDDEQEEQDEISPAEEVDQAKPPPKQQQPWTKGITDAISLGNLDIFQDSAIAQTPSEYARKLVPWKRPGSAVGAAAPPSSSSQPYFLPTGLLDSSGGAGGGGRRHTPGGSRIQTIEEIPSFDQQDRDISEQSESPPPPPTSASPTLVDTKDAGVQTPTRISKTASHKQRAAPKPRKTWSRGSPGGGESSVISTESEEIVEVHHVGGGLPEDQNPLGRMRKRFHQFLDDAFNVMGGRQGDEDIQGQDNHSSHRTAAAASGGGGSRRAGGRAAETQSAKVSISHEVVETETEWRPWTSHVIREETLQKLRRGRPKSAAVPAQIIGPPKPAWTASSERRTHSAKQRGGGGGQPASSSAGQSRMGSAVDIQQQGGGVGGGADGGRISDGGFFKQRTFTSAPDDDDEDVDTYDRTSTRDDPPPRSKQQTVAMLSSASAATTTAVDPQSSTLSSHSQSVILSPAFIFPQYPAYPDIRVTMGGSIVGGGGPISSTSTGSSTLSQQSQQGPASSSHNVPTPPPPPPPPPTLPPNDPAVPLIQAIKDEMKRFEKDPPASGGSSSGGGGRTAK